MRKEQRYTGPERRIRPINDRRCDLNCFEHSGLVQRVSNAENRIDDIERTGFLSVSQYRWTTGLLVSILIAVLSASLYTTFQASEALAKVKDNQVKLMTKMDFLQYDIEQIKKKVP